MKSRNKRIACISAIALATSLAYNGTVAFAGTKNEVVFITMDSNGDTKNITVSNHIESDGKKEIKDKSSLENITNLKGKESPIKDGESLTWKTNGDDVYYQGTIKKDLPVDTNIKYYLNDKEVKGEELAGKTGKLKIQIQQKNNISQVKNIDGQNRLIYTPFYSLVALPFETDYIKNIKVSDGGKLISDGKREVAFGVLLPGMKENLKDVEDVDIYDSLEIEGDIENFKMSSIYINTSSKLPDIKNIDGIGDLSNMTSDLERLVDASKKLVDGSNALANGVTTYSEKMQEYQGGVTTFMSGVETVMNSLDKAGEGVTKLHDGTNSLAENAGVFVGKGNELIAGAQTQAEAIGKVNQALGAIAATLPDGQQKQMLLGLQGKVTELSNGSNIYVKGITDYVGAAGQLKQGIDMVNGGACELYNGFSAVGNGKSQLNEGKNKLEGATSALVSASGQLKEGADTLKDGMLKFNNEGIMKLYNTVNEKVDEVKKIQDIEKEVVGMADEYDTFSGNDSENTSKVSFVCKTEAIEKKVDKKDTDKSENHKETSSLNKEVCKVKSIKPSVLELVLNIIKK
ncbi:hypothetical protein [Clostridium chauvoei]|uniref:X-X-X-Leu-X-X-Gly heptad repeats n=2 Tax=Clostridium chauvoei TaxID=46867 RepID=S6ELF4_9CLOT|nr:hypothetical protein [Clostridium chauvoei]ATD55352.1 hypothetical protein BTM20_08915 [Clostridium chauvoei]MBX7280864.1 hypothetical protein [Clostridium chauvoei]MBX7283347.1 hypothetical protein [Clostridium chauvoei]MBX7285821.1 hypothetical protein [Clostridium chauvoei]MBX7288351.1 hypothetical protein [Clostridium chauvoei]